MKTIRTLSLSLVVVAVAACHAHHRPIRTEPTVAQESEREANEVAKSFQADVEKDYDATADAQRAGGSDFITAIEGSAGEMTASAGDAVSGASASVGSAANATLDGAADASASVASSGNAVLDRIAKDTVDAGKKIDDAAKNVKSKTLAAEIESIDRHANEITFRIRDGEKDVELQSGREMKVDFDDLQRLTGLKKDEALAKMHEGEDVDLKVAGRGEDAKVVRIELGDF